MPKLTPRFQTRTRLKNGVTAIGWPVSSVTSTTHLLSWSSTTVTSATPGPERSIAPPAALRRRPAPRPRRGSGGRDPAPRRRSPTSGSTCQQRAHLAPARARGTTPTPGDVGEREGARRRRARRAARCRSRSRARRDRAPASSLGVGRADEHLRRRLEARADPLVAALDLERAGDHPPHPADPLPAGAERRVEPGRRELRELAQMDAAVRRRDGARARPPRR